MVIYIDTPFKDEQKLQLHKVIKADELIFKDEIKYEAKQLEALLSADIVLGNPTPAWLQKAVSAKWVQLYSVGFEYYSNVKIPAIVTNMKGYYAQPCAETLVAGIMALYRGIDRYSVLKEGHSWVGYVARERLQLLNNKRVIILGAGSVAKHLQKILKGFDCEVTFFARSPNEAAINTAKELEQAIPVADIMIGCLPGTEETRGLFNAAMINSMKPGAIFCNIGRGNLLKDESSLIDALRSGKIGGAVLDVTANEPLPPDHPLWDCPNTILTQHSGGGSNTEYEGILSFFLENLKLFKESKPLKNVIQVQKGY